MAMSMIPDASSEKYRSGFDCQFVDAPKELQSECPVCLSILREPCQVTCCGKSFCRACIERIREEGDPCPTCNEEEYSHFSNKGLQQSLYSFKVYCAYAKKGCKWSGELGQYDKHMNLNPQPDEPQEGCMYAEVNCKYNHVGCDARLLRKDMPNHLSKEMATHVNLLENENRLLREKLKAAHSDNDWLKLQTNKNSKSLSPPVTFVMTNVLQYVRDDDYWFSPPFYSHPQGYKMCFSVVPNGWGIAKGIYLSSYVYMMRGEFDDDLKWPFRGEVTIRLLNQDEDKEKEDKHCVKTNYFEGEGKGRRVIRRNQAEAGYGTPDFVPIMEVPQYLKNDTLAFEVVKVVVKK